MVLKVIATLELCCDGGGGMYYICEVAGIILSSHDLGRSTHLYMMVGNTAMKASPTYLLPF